MTELDEGRGGALWINGEPGIGKTLLVAAGLGSAEALGMRLFRAVGDELTPAYALRYLADALLAPEAELRMALIHRNPKCVTFHSDYAEVFVKPRSVDLACAA